MVADNVKDVVRSLEEVGENMITWCSDNQIKMNIDKCHQLLNGSWKYDHLVFWQSNKDEYWQMSPASKWFLKIWSIGVLTIK